MAGPRLLKKQRRLKLLEIKRALEKEAWGRRRAERAWEVFVRWDPCGKLSNGIRLSYLGFHWPSVLGESAFMAKNPRVQFAGHMIIQLVGKNGGEGHKTK